LLFLYSDKLSRRRIHRNGELGVIAIRAIDYVPYQLIGIVVPVADVDHRGSWIFFQNLISAMFLRDGKGLIGIDLQEGWVKNLSRRIAGIVNILISWRNAWSWRVRGVAA